MGAMRAFGYRNVHLMALPLVGGVAIGQDVNPSAYRSDWMSLMGPLPGILIGWGILISVWTGFWPSAVGDPTTWVILLLVINYRNVLPILPLDGGHVMQALLPSRQAWIEVGFVAVACTLGAWVAWQFDFVILSVLALLQLLGLSGRLKAQRELARIASDPLPADAARGMRIRKVAEVLDRVALKSAPELIGCWSLHRRSLGPSSIALSIIVMPACWICACGHGIQAFGTMRSGVLPKWRRHQAIDQGGARAAQLRGAGSLN